MPGYCQQKQPPTKHDRKKAPALIKSDLLTKAIGKSHIGRSQLKDIGIHWLPLPGGFQNDLHKCRGRGSSQGSTYHLKALTHRAVGRRAHLRTVVRPGRTLPSVTESSRDERKYVAADSTRQPRPQDIDPASAFSGDSRYRLGRYPVPLPQVGPGQGPRNNQAVQTRHGH